MRDQYGGHDMQGNPENDGLLAGQAAQPDTPKLPIQPPALSIVVPCYNEDLVLDTLHERASKVARDCFGDDYELLLIDDGSTDGTRQMIMDMADRTPQTRGIFLSRNHGHQKALSAGLSLARGARILILDADLQDPPELLPDMLKLMDEGADVVYGQRISRSGESLGKRATAAGFYRVLDRMVDIKIPLDTGDFRLMSRRALDVLNDMPEEHRFIRGMVSWIGFNQVPLKYERQERHAGETKYPLKKMVRLAIDAITGFSILPLRLAIGMSLVVAVFGFLLIGYVIVSTLVGRTVEGWASVMVVMLLLGSVQLLGIGILGEYLGRLFMQSKKRPLFIVESLYSGRAKASKDDTSDD